MRNQIKYTSKNLIGSAVIALGLSLNKWVIERFLPDKTIENPSYIIKISVVQLILVFCGIYLIMNGKVLKRAVAAIIFLIPFLAFSIVNLGGVKLLNTKSDKKHTKSPSQTILDQVIFLDENKTAQLSQETGEVLYSTHQNEFPLTFKVPEYGILDTAVGIDPLISNLFTGNVYFTLSVTRNKGRPQTIFKKDITLSKLSEREFVWQRVSIDLSEYSGREITLTFGKGYESDSQKKPEAVYDLVPTDLMYWRTPNVRTERLKDKYNVILISLDTLRADHLHFMGYPRETSPNLDRLARNGTFFTAAISQAPWTTPSRFSIFTSTYPSVHKGNQTIQTRGRSWDGKLPNMASILRDKGYATAAFTGKGSISAKFGFIGDLIFITRRALFQEKGLRANTSAMRKRYSTNLCDGSTTTKTGASSFSYTPTSLTPLTAMIFL